MKSLTHSDLFLFLRNSGCGLTMQESLIDFVSRECELNLSEQSRNKLRLSLKLFCSNLSSRGQKSNRTLQNFTKKNESWLQKVFEFSLLEIFSNCSDESASTSSSHNKPFDEITDRHKRRRTEDLRASNSTEILLYATKQKLSSDGSSDFAKIQTKLSKLRLFAKIKLRRLSFRKKNA